MPQKSMGAVEWGMLVGLSVLWGGSFLFMRVLAPVIGPLWTADLGGYLATADTPNARLLERGIVEESGRSQFGAVLYRTTDLFLRLFGLRTLDELPDISAFDPSPELQEELRERLLRAGEARAAS